MIQKRIIPRLANAILGQFSAETIEEMYRENQPKVLDKKNKRTDVVHALSTFIKVKNSSDCQEFLLEMRQLMGGLGYSQYSGLP